MVTDIQMDSSMRSVELIKCALAECWTQISQYDYILISYCINGSKCISVCIVPGLYCSMVCTKSIPSRKTERTHRSDVCSSTQMFGSIQFGESSRIWMRFHGDWSPKITHLCVYRNQDNSETLAGRKRANAPGFASLCQTAHDSTSHFNRMRQHGRDTFNRISVNPGHF